MMNTEFILFIGTDQYIIDLSNDVNIPLSFNIEDLFKVDAFFDVTKRSWNASNTFNIPGTINNNKALNSIYDINTLSSFDPTVETRVLLKQQGIIVFDGVFCLDGFQLDNKGYPLFYSVTIVGRAFNIKVVLARLSVKDLDFSEYDHAYDMERAYGSWFNDITINATPGQANKTTTYTSPAVTAETAVVVDGLNRIKLTFAAPHAFAVDDEVYVEGDYVTPPVATAQYAFDQQVLTVPSTTEIVLRAYNPTAPYSGTFVTTVKKQQLTGIGYWYPMINYGTYIKTFYASGFLGGNGLLQDGVEYIIKSYSGGNDFTNVGAGANQEGEIFTVSPPAVITGGALVIGVEYVISVYAANDDFNNVGGPIAYPTNNQWDGFTFVATGTTPTTWTAGTQILQTGLGGYAPTLWTSSSVLIQMSGNETLNSKYGDDNTTTFGATDTFWEIRDFIPHIFLREILVKIFELIGYEWDCPMFDSKLFRRLILPLQQTFNVPEGNTIVMNDWLPDIKLIDILSDCINMFNLAMIPDRDNRILIHFENRGTFFDKTPVDWTNKLNSALGLRIKLMNTGFPKIYNFTNKQSSDFFNTDFKNDWAAVYGDYLYDTQNDFSKSEIKIESIFEPSVLTGFSVVNAQGVALIASSFDADVGTGENVKRKISNRLLIAGMRHTGGGGVNFISNVNPADNITFVQWYPYAGHIDNHFQPHPTWDINWGKPPGIYFTPSSASFPTIVTDSDWDENALYKKQWKRYINQITNPNVKIATGVFKLSVIDIFDLDLTYPVRVGEYILRLNKVSQWNINSDGQCSVEALTRVE